MTLLAEIAETPEYDAAASSASKGTIGIFLLTFAYMLFFSGTGPDGLLGFIALPAFFAVGIYAASLLIAMPLFLLRLKIPSLVLVFTVADIVLTIVATKAAYLWLFSRI